MGVLDELIFAARAGLMTLERQEAELLARRYATLAAQIAQTTTDLATAISAAGPAAAEPDWLERQVLYQQLQHGIDRRMAQVGQYATNRIASIQALMIQRGNSHGVALLRTLGADGNSLSPAGHAEQLAVARRRLEAYDLARTLPTLARQLVRNAATKVTLLGLGVAGITERLRGGFGGVLSKLLFLLRAEAVTPHRDTTLAVFTHNGVDLWQWFAEIEQTPPPCGMCVAMHGKTFPIATAFATHHGCRCLPVPVLPHAPHPIAVGGQAWLDAQPPATRHAVLGPSKLHHYESGQLRLADLVGDDQLPDGQPARRERSLKDLGLDRVRATRPASQTSTAR